MTFRPGRYQHYKGGLYTAIDVARHSETDELMVVYRPEYGERALWVRPLAMFYEDVFVDGVAKPRFMWIAPLPLNTHDPFDGKTPE